jgi:hypothetical protein
MIASEDFKRLYISICRELEKHLDPRDIRTPLHGCLANKMAQIEMAENLDAAGLLTPELEKEYQDAIEARDEMLAQLGLDHDPRTDPIRLN